MSWSLQPCMQTEGKQTCIVDATGYVLARVPAPVWDLKAKADPRDRPAALKMAAADDMLAALRLALPVCEDAYYDAVALEQSPTGDAADHPAENKQSTAAALAAWEAVKAAIVRTEGREG